MRISVVIRAYNEEEHIERLMLGIRAQTLKPVEVILVDSGSTDATAAIAQRHGAIVVPIAKQEFTFGRALNRGCAAATGDVLVFASAHVYPLHDDWLAQLAAPFEDERVVLSYGRQQGNHKNKFSEHQIFARWFPAHSVCPQRSYFCNNANCAIRRSTWLAQPYDETLTGLEDLAWAKAAQEKGGWLAYVAEADIVHVHDESWPQVLNRYRREAIAMRSIDSHAKFSRVDFAWLLVQNIVSDLGVALRQGMLRQEAGSILRFRYNQLRGTYMGYNGPPEVTAEMRARFYYPATSRDRNALRGLTARRQIDYDDLLATRADAARTTPQRANRAEPNAAPPATEGEVVDLFRRH